MAIHIRILSWALIFILRLRFPPGKSLVNILTEVVWCFRNQRETSNAIVVIHVEVEPDSTSTTIANWSPIELQQLRLTFPLNRHCCKTWSAIIADWITTITTIRKPGFMGFENKISYSGLKTDVLSKKVIWTFQLLLQPSSCRGKSDKVMLKARSLD